LVIHCSDDTSSPEKADRT